MKRRLEKIRLRSLLAKNAKMCWLVAALLAVNSAQALYILTKSERTVLVPPELSQEVWVEKGRVSASYLEEMTLFLTTLILDASPSSSAFQRDVVLRYVDSASYASVKRYLLNDEERLKKLSLSTSFKPTQVHVDTASNKVRIVGELMGYVGGRRVSQVKEMYELKFTFKKGRLWLSEFQLVEEKNDA